MSELSEILSNFRLKEYDVVDGEVLQFYADGNESYKSEYFLVMDERLAISDKVYGDGVKEL